MRKVEVLFSEDGNKEVSIYSGQPLATDEQIRMMFDSVGTIYPIVRDRYNKEPGGWPKFVSLMVMAIKARHFTYEQLKDAYNKMLETPTYNGQLEIASFLNNDIRIKFYTRRFALDKDEYTPAEFYDPKDERNYKTFIGGIMYGKERAYVMVQDYDRARELYIKGLKKV